MHVRVYARWMHMAEHMVHLSGIDCILTLALRVHGRAWREVLLGCD